MAGMLDAAKVQRRARRAGFLNFYQLAQGFRARGFKCSESQAKRFWTGNTDPKLSSMERLCEVLGCEITSLIQRNGQLKGTAK